MSVRRAGPGDEEAVRRLRLQALSESPEAFDSTLERERSRTSADWSRWLFPGATFLLEDPQGPAGLAAGVPHDTDPRTAFLMSVWVRPDLRGGGAAEALIGAVLDWARGNGYAHVLLHVGAHNHRARRAYEKNGFRATGGTIRNERTGLLEVEMRHGPEHGPVIRRALPEDAGRLSAVARAAKAGWGYPPDVVASWESMLRISPDYVARELVFAAVRGDGIVGFHALERKADHWVLEHLWVDPAAQGRGTGRLLYEHALALVRETRPGRVVIEGDPHAAGFYARMGARETGSVPAPLPGDPGRRLPLFEVRVDEAGPGST